MDKYIPFIAIGTAILAIGASIYEGILLRRKAKLWEGREDGR